VKRPTTGLPRSPANRVTLNAATPTVTLANGLTIIVNRAPGAPLVGLQVVYRIGSRDEAPKQLGLAHLCEHLLFAGAPGFPGNLFRYLENLGASSINAVAREDYTACFAVVPRSNLAAALALEAARMRTLTFGRAQFELQRRVLRNELRQRESEPFGILNRLISEKAYPPAHPYAHPPDGTIDSLERLTFDEVRAWCRYFNPRNATLVLAGDLDEARALALARRHFAAIPPGSASPNRDRTATLPRDRATVRLPSAHRRVFWIRHAPPLSNPAYAHLALLVEILNGLHLYRPACPLFRLTSGLHAELRARDLVSQLLVSVDPLPKVSLAAVDRAMRTELEALGTKLLHPAEIAAAQRRCLTSYLRALENLCGPNSRTEMLAMAALFAADPLAYRQILATVAAAKPNALRECARNWLGPPSLTVVFGDRAAARPPLTSASRRARRSRPSTAALLDSDPSIIRLSHLAPRCGARLVIRHGWADDPSDKSGRAAVALAALTGSDAFRTLRKTMAGLGIAVETRLNADSCSLSLTAPACLESRLAAAIPAIARIRVKLDDAALAAAKRRILAAIAAERCRPLELAQRLLPPELFPPYHPCARPFTGTGTREAVQGLTTADLAEFFDRARATSLLLVAGPSSRRSDRVPARIPAAPAPIADAFTAPITIGAAALIHDPRRPQTAIFMARTLPPFETATDEALRVADVIIGGCFSSRLNLCLRERGGYTYGARTAFTSTRRGGLWMAATFVDSAGALPALRAINREFTIRRQPFSSAEQAAAINFLRGRIAAETGTLHGRLNQLEERLALGSSPTARRRAKRLHGLRPDEINATLDDLFRQRPPAWLIIGDAAPIAPALAALGYRPTVITQ